MKKKCLFSNDWFIVMWLLNIRYLSTFGILDMVPPAVRVLQDVP